MILNKRVNLNVTGDFLTHLFRLPEYFFDTRRIGDITARINDSMQIHQAILLFTNATIIDGMIIIGSLLVIRGKILPGQFMACYSLLANILPSIIAMVGAYISIQGAHIAAKD